MMTCNDLLATDGRSIRAAPLWSDKVIVRRSLLLFEQILKNERPPNAVAGVNQRAALVELSQADGCEPELFGQIRHGRYRVLVVARQKDNPMPVTSVAAIR